MPNKSRSFVRLFDHNDHYIKFVDYDTAAKRVRDGQWADKERSSGRLVAVKMLGAPPPPSNSTNSHPAISVRECKANAFACLKIKLGEKLAPHEEIVLEKLQGFTPGTDSYLGPAWSDRLVHASV